MNIWSLFFCVGMVSASRADLGEIFSELFPVAGNGSSHLLDLIGNDEIARIDHKLIETLFTDIAGSDLTILVDLELFYREDPSAIRARSVEIVTNEIAAALETKGHDICPTWKASLYLWLLLRRLIAEGVERTVSNFDFTSTEYFDVVHALEIS